MIEREELLKSLFFFKDRVDFLQSRKFFKDLLGIYKDLETVEGFVEWAGIFRDLEEGNCTSCDERKMRLLEGLIFTFEESKILELIQRISDLEELFREFS